MSSGVPLGPTPAPALRLVVDAAYVQLEISPRFVQLSQGCARLHLSLRFLHGAHDSGTLFRFRTTRNWPWSGDAPVEEVVDGGVGTGIGIL